MRARLGIAALALGGLSLPLCLAAQEVPPGPAATIAGAWILNPESSDLPPGDMAMPAGRGSEGGHGPGGGRPPGGGMGMPGGGGGRAGGPGGQGRPSDEEMQRMRDLVRELLEPSTRLTIVMKGGEVAITNARGRTQRFATNGTKEKHQLNAGTIETKTRWNGSQLVQEISASNGLKLVDTFAIDPQTGQLRLTMKFEGGRGPEEPMQRVYDQALEQK